MRIFLTHAFFRCKNNVVNMAGTQYIRSYGLIIYYTKPQTCCLVGTILILVFIKRAVIILRMNFNVAFTVDAQTRQQINYLGKIIFVIIFRFHSLTARNRTFKRVYFRRNIILKYSPNIIVSIRVWFLYIYNTFSICTCSIDTINKTRRYFKIQIPIFINNMFSITA